jgi:FkbM family methyltransferase
MIQDNGWYRHEDDAAFSQKLADDFPITGSTAFDKHKKILDNLNLSNKRTALDIGAYYGVWSTVLSNDFNIVHAFEPSTSNCECFRKNTEDISNIELYNVAVSHRYNKKIVLSDGETYDVNIFLKDGVLYKQGEIAIMELTDEADHSSFRFIRADIPEIESKFSALTDRSSDIPMKEIDEYDFADVDLINLHTNGSEYLTIMGAINTIQTYRPVIIYQLYADQMGYYSHDESTVNFDSGIRESNESFNINMTTVNNFLTSLGYTIKIVNTFSEWDIKYRIAVPD